MRALLAFVVVSTASSCATTTNATVPATTQEIFVWTSPPWTFDTNLYFVDVGDHLVAIDTGFLPKDAEAAIAFVEAKTNKPIRTAIVLHPNPDKFNGADTFSAHGARVVTSSQVLAAIPHVA